MASEGDITFGLPQLDILNNFMPCSSHWSCASSRISTKLYNLSLLPAHSCRTHYGAHIFYEAFKFYFIFLILCEDSATLVGGRHLLFKASDRVAMFVLETSSDKSEIASQVNEHDSVNDLCQKHGDAQREGPTVNFSFRFEA